MRNKPRRFFGGGLEGVKANARYYKSLREWKALDSVSRRVLFHDYEYKSIVKVMSIVDNSDKISVCMYELRPTSKGHNTFVKSTIHSYCSFNKKTNKYYEDGHPEELCKILATAGGKTLAHLEWFSDFMEYRKLRLSKRLRKQLLTGKITNSKQLITKYLSERGFKNIPVKPLIGENMRNLNWILFLARLGMSSNPARDCMKVASLCGEDNGHYISHQLKDTLDLAKMLGKKVNFQWSDKKMKQVHDDLSYEVNKVKLDNLKEQSLDYPDYVVTESKDKTIKLLTNKSEFFLEGDELRHCVFSANYFSNAMNRNCFIFSIDREERATAEVVVPYYHTPNDDFKLRVQQIRGKYNGAISDKVKEDFERILKEEFEPSLKVLLGMEEEEEEPMLEPEAPLNGVNNYIVAETPAVLADLPF